MKNKLVSKTEISISISYVIFIILGALFMFAISYQVFYINEQINKNSKIFEIILSLCFPILSFYCIFHLLNLKKIFIYTDYFVVKNLFYLRKYYFKDILRYYEEDFEGEYNSWTEFNIISNTGKRIKIINTYYSNYNSIKFDLMKKIKKNSKLNEIYLKKNL
jgi:hypothetical protein